MQLLFHRDSGFLGGLVSRFTRSPYSHVSIWFPQWGVGFEAAPFRGVQLFTKKPEGVDAFFAPCDDEAARRFAARQVGKPYDWSNVLKFACFARPQNRQTRKESGRWFCAEYAEVCCEEGGLDLLSGNPWEHSPRDLALSLKITPAL